MPLHEKKDNSEGEERLFLVLDSSKKIKVPVEGPPGNCEISTTKTDRKRSHENPAARESGWNDRRKAR